MRLPRVVQIRHQTSHLLKPHPQTTREQGKETAKTNLDSSIIWSKERLYRWQMGGAFLCVPSRPPPCPRGVGVPFSRACSLRTDRPSAVTPRACPGTERGRGVPCSLRSRPPHRLSAVSGGACALPSLRFYAMDSTPPVLGVAPGPACLFEDPESADAMVLRDLSVLQRAGRRVMANSPPGSRGRQSPPSVRDVICGSAELRSVGLDARCAGTGLVGSVSADNLPRPPSPLSASPPRSPSGGRQSPVASPNMVALASLGSSRPSVRAEIVRILANPTGQKD